MINVKLYRVHEKVLETYNAARYNSMNNREWQRIWNDTLTKAWNNGWEKERDLVWHIKYHEIAFLKDIVRDKVIALLFDKAFAEAAFGDTWRTAQEDILRTIQETGSVSMTQVAELAGV